MNTTPWLHPGIAPSGKPFAPLRGSSLRFVATLVIFLATLGTTSRAIAQQQTPDSSLTYSELIEKIEQDQVRRIVFDQTTRKAHVFLRDQENPERSQEVPLFYDNPELLAAINNQIAAGLDRQDALEFEQVRSNDGGAVINLFANLLLIFILVGGLFFMIRRSAQASGQAMSFGKSKARFQMEAKTGVVFTDVAGVEEAKEELAEIVTFLQEPEKFTAIGAKIPRGMLLVGPPGTGKTLLAKAIAGEAKVPFFSLSGSEFVEMFVGVGASRVRDLFKKAKENAPCLIFIDEIDAVGRQRGAGIGGANDEREQTLNQLLTEIDGFEGNNGIIVIAATNRPDVLDAALLRPGRFDRQVMVDYPDYQGRLGILEVHARDKKLSKGVSLEAIARRTPGFTGADLANLLNESAIFTARRRKEAITMDEVNDAIDRVVAGMEGKALVDSKSKRLIAYHELGHAIVASFCPGHDPVEKVTLIPRGQAQGLTWFTPDEDRGLVSRSQLLAKIAVLLAGRAAEEVVFGTSEVTTGAGNDIERVTNLARQMVTRFGMSALGPVALGEEQGEVFLGQDFMRSGPTYSEEVATDIDHQVRSLILGGYQRAKAIIRDHRQLVDYLVDILIEEETIEGDRFRAIIQQYQGAATPDLVKR